MVPVDVTQTFRKDKNKVFFDSLDIRQKPCFSTTKKKKKHFRDIRVLVYILEQFPLPEKFISQRMWLFTVIVFTICNQNLDLHRFSRYHS